MRATWLVAGLAAAWIGWAAPAWAGDDPWQTARGPFEIRDEWIPAQVRLSLPGFSPDPLCRGEWSLRAGHTWGSDFGYSQHGWSESPDADRRFFVDGEHRTVDVAARYGLTSSLGVGIRVPVHWRGGGFMDGLIDWWHELGGFQTNGRERFYQDLYRVQGRDADFNAYAWEDSGLGLGNVEVEARWAFLRPRRRSGWRAALAGRLTVPTATGPFVTDSVDAGLQVAVGKQLGRRFDVYGGVGGTFYSEDTIEGFQYEPWRAHGFLAVEWRATPWVSVIVQADASSRLITNLVNYPNHQVYLHVGFRGALSRRAELYAAFTENIQHQQSTTDFMVLGGLELRLGP